MSQPVKLSDDLVCDARAMSDLSARSIAGQIEFWAQLGRSLEPLLRGDRVTALLRSAQQRSVSAAVSEVDSPGGRRRVADLLQRRPFPHYEAVADSPGSLRRIEEDGTVTIGRFVNRVFVPNE